MKQRKGMVVGVAVGYELMTYQERIQCSCKDMAKDMIDDNALKR